MPIEFYRFLRDAEIEYVQLLTSEEDKLNYLASIASEEFSDPDICESLALAWLIDIESE